jgi:hypothetical protein
VVDGADEVDAPKENGAGGVIAGVVDLAFPNENPVVWVGVAIGVVEAPPGPAPKENTLSLVGVLSSRADPRASGLVGLGDSDANENGLDCGVVLTFKAGVVLGKNAVFTGEGVEGVVEAGRDGDDTGVVVIGGPNENGAGVGFASGAATTGAGAEGFILPNEKGFGGSFIPSFGGETDTVGIVGSGDAPKENGLATGVSTFTGWATRGKVKPGVKPDPVAAGFVVPGAGRKLNPDEEGADVAWTGGAVIGAGVGANENGDGGLGCAIGATLGMAAGAGVKGPKPNDTGGAAGMLLSIVAGTAFTLAKGFEGNAGACGGVSCVIGVMLKTPRMLDSVGVVDIISLPVESLLLYDSFTGLMFIGLGTRSTCMCTIITKTYCCTRGILLGCLLTIFNNLHII